MTFGIHLSKNPHVVSERLWGFIFYQTSVLRKPAPDWCELRLEEGFIIGGLKEK